MIFLPGLAVIFAGLLGGNGDVDTQVKTVVRKLGVKTVTLPAASLRTLTHHSDATRPLVRSLHADGVIACEIVRTNGSASLRIVIYEGDGKLKTFSEVPLTGRGLTRDDLEVLRSNLADDVAAMRGTEAEPEPEPEIEIDPLPAKLPPAKTPPAKAPANAIVATAPPAKTPPPTKAIVTPPTKAIVAPAPAKQLPLTEKALVASVPPAKQSPPAEKAPQASDDEVAFADDATDTAAADDAVSADEIAALTAGVSESAPALPVRSLHFGAAAGIGLASRAFTAPSTVAAYSSSPVAAITLDAHVRPTKRLALSIGTERSLQLTTPMRDGSAAATTISHWDAAGTYELARLSTAELGAHVGVGRRAFSIDSNDPGRSPDGDYNYLIAGVVATMHVGQRLAVRAHASFEPVLFGTEPTEMAFGEASRWAVEVGAALELRASSHVFVRASAEYQRFKWSWDMAGERGAGGAIDEYPFGALALGADY